MCELTITNLISLVEKNAPENTGKIRIKVNGSDIKHVYMKGDTVYLEETEDVNNNKEGYIKLV